MKCGAREHHGCGREGPAAAHDPATEFRSISQRVGKTARTCSAKAATRGRLVVGVSERQQDAQMRQVRKRRIQDVEIRRNGFLRHDADGKSGACKTDQTSKTVARIGLSCSGNPARAIASRAARWSMAFDAAGPGHRVAEIMQLQCRLAADQASVSVLMMVSTSFRLGVETSARSTLCDCRSARNSAVGADTTLISTSGILCRSS